MTIKSLSHKTLITVLLLVPLIGCSPQTSESVRHSLATSSAISTSNIRAPIDSKLVASLKNIPPQLSSITRDTLIATRAALSEIPNFPATPGISVEKKLIKTADGDVSIYIYQPENYSENKPAILWIHGGGYIMGSADSNYFSGAFSKQLNATVVSVDYRLAPEHPFPAALNDSHAALLWMVKHAEDLGISPSRIAVAGQSAGAGLATGLVLYNRDMKGPEIAFQLLLYPMLDNLHDTPSGSIEDYPVWNRQTSFNAWEMYFNGTPGLNASPYGAAAREKDVSGLPKTFITVGTADLFRDENIEYAQRLMAAGVPTQLAVFPGMFHAGQIFSPNAPISQQMILSYSSALKDGLAIPD